MNKRAVWVVEKSYGGKFSPYTNFMTRKAAREYVKPLKKIGSFRLVKYVPEVKK